MRRLEHAAFELDALEAVEIDHALRLRHDLRGADAFAPGVGCVGFADVFGVLEEQVGAVGHGVAHLAAQQVHHRRPGDLALQVEHADFKSADHLGHVLDGVGARGQFKFDSARHRLDGGAHTFFHHIQREGRQANQQWRGLLQNFEHGLVAIGFGDAHPAIAGLDLDDGAQRPGLVDTGRVKQRAVAESDGGDPDMGDGDVACHGFTLRLRRLCGRGRPGGSHLFG